jgi:uncharacterized protein YqgC (DUF456 family)
VSPGAEVVVGLVILVGLIGVVVQVLPGALIILAAIVVWAVVTGGGWAWATVAIAVVAVGVSAVGKYVLAGRHLKRSEVPSSTLVWGGVAGVVGFFVIPVVGLLVGFVLGVYLAELARRRDPAPAWRATVVALTATGITILVELAGALVAAGAWLVAALWLT